MTLDDTYELSKGLSTLVTNSVIIGSAIALGGPLGLAAIPVMGGLFITTKAAREGDCYGPRNGGNIQKDIAVSKAQNTLNPYSDVAIKGILTGAWQTLWRPAVFVATAAAFPLDVIGRPLVKPFATIPVWLLSKHKDKNIQRLWNATPSLRYTLHDVFNRMGAIAPNANAIEYIERHSYLPAQQKNMAQVTN